jgi:hypothetical protein
MIPLRLGFGRLDLELGVKAPSLLPEPLTLGAECLELLDLLEGRLRIGIDDERICFLELNPDPVDLGEIGPELLL